MLVSWSSRGRATWGSRQPTRNQPIFLVKMRGSICGGGRQPYCCWTWWRWPRTSRIHRVPQTSRSSSSSRRPIAVPPGFMERPPTITSSLRVAEGPSNTWPSTGCTITCIRSWSRRFRHRISLKWRVSTLERVRGATSSIDSMHHLSHWTSTKWIGSAFDPLSGRSSI